MGTQLQRTALSKRIEFANSFACKERPTSNLLINPTGSGTLQKQQRTKSGLWLSKSEWRYPKHVVGELKARLLWTQLFISRGAVAC